MTRVSLLLILLAWGTGLFAQKDKPAVFLGYFAPYGSQFGGKAAVSFHVKNWKKEDQTEARRTHQFYLSPQFGYFVFPSVQRNYLFNLESVYQRTRPNKRFAPTASVGLGYLLARQQQEGAVHLGTGEITYEVTSLHYFTPTIGLGFNIIPKKVIGYYLKGFYGRKITSQQENAAIFGLEGGLIFNVGYKN